LADALVLTGDPADAIPSYEVVKQRISEMEPDARERWGPGLEKDVATAAAKVGGGR